MKHQFVVADYHTAIFTGAWRLEEGAFVANKLDRVFDSDPCKEECQLEQTRRCGFEVDAA
jgi:hypothetical protein